MNELHLKRHRYVVAYDLVDEKSETYNTLASYLEKNLKGCRMQRSVWFVESVKTESALLKELLKLPQIDRNDKILVANICGWNATHRPKCGQRFTTSPIFRHRCSVGPY